LPRGTFLGGGSGPDGKAIYAFVADDKREIHHIPVFQMYPLFPGQTVHLQPKEVIEDLVAMAMNFVNPRTEIGKQSAGEAAVTRTEYSDLLHQVCTFLVRFCCCIFSFYLFIYLFEFNFYSGFFVFMLAFFIVVF
jgi:hypothetical protein